MCVCVCDGDVRWFSVGTRGPVGVDNPTAEASSWGRGWEQTASWWVPALCLLRVTHTIPSTLESYFLFSSSTSLLYFHYCVWTTSDFSLYLHIFNNFPVIIDFRTCHFWNHFFAFICTQAKLILKQKTFHIDIHIDTKKVMQLNVVIIYCGLPPSPLSFLLYRLWLPVTASTRPSISS